MNPMDMWIDKIKIGKINCPKSHYYEPSVRQYGLKYYHKHSKMISFSLEMFNVDVDIIPQRLDAIEN